MAEVQVPFAVQEGNSSSPQNSQETLVNMWAEVETGGRKKLIRRQRPGLSHLNVGETAAYNSTNVDSSVGMKVIERYGALYFFGLDSFMVWFDTLTEERGSIGFGSVALDAFVAGVNVRCGVVFNDNGDVFIVAEGQAVNIPVASLRATPSAVYPGSYTTLTGLSDIATPDDVAVGTVAFLAGRGVFNVPNTGTFYWTDINDFTTIDALSFATAESFQDPILRVFTLNNQLILWGSYSTEFWVPTSSADSPFQPITNATMNRGIAGPYALAADDNTVFWLGDDGIVYRLDGYRPSRVSTASIERVIADQPIGDRAGCDGFVYTFDGQKFVTFRFGSVSIQYNVATGLWNLATSGERSAWMVMGSANRASEFLLTPTGPVTIDDTVNTDQGATIYRKMISAPADANGKRITVSDLLLDVEVGRMAEGVEPKIMLRFAKDGEQFGNTKTRSLGTTGNYKRRVMYRNLGQGRRATIEVSMSDDVSLKVMNAVANVKVDNS